MPYFLYKWVILYCFYDYPQSKLLFLFNFWRFARKEGFFDD